ncbi:hypothetical protein [Streptomyces sp. IB201691-2A2]|uniref:hypothetical protein n=1 Tax=Streptomyces sp. IB201691-2A2 TaxID=2561920 RepID=UPI001CA68D7C|nr:hypothetical protein [Streptomyces sp. IB201691-2A2]
MTNLSHSEKSRASARPVVVSEHVEQELADRHHLDAVPIEQPERQGRVAGLLDPADPRHHECRDIP